MKVRFWGVRGSFPSPGTRTTHYGGNTSCIQVLTGSDIIVCDAGTGIRDLGLTLNHKPATIHLFLTHTHWDHIQGFPFFNPIYRRGYRLNIYGPRAFHKSVKETLMVQMDHSFHPVSVAELAARLNFRDLDEEELTVGKVRVATKVMNHPITSVAYRFTQGEKKIVYTGDHEPYSGPGHERKTREIVRFISGADLLIADATYTDKEYRTKKGWGHSPISYTMDLAAQAGVKKLAFFHHDHTHTDRDLRAIEKAAQRKARGSSRLTVFMAREGQTITV